MLDFAEPLWLLLLLTLPALIWLRRWARVSERRFTGTALRCLALSALIVALAGPLKASYSPHTDVMFALDLSRSIEREAAAEALSFINHAIAAKDPDSRIGLVGFGADASVELLLRRAAEPVREISVDVQRGGTDIEQALGTAMAAFHSEGHRRVVLLSDGRENLGRARSMAGVARSLGVEIFSIALEKDATRDEVLVRDITAPARVRVHEPFEVEIVLESKNAARAHLVIRRNGAPLDDITLTLKPGRNVHSLVDKVSLAGLYEYEAVINSEADDIQENNRYQAFVHVRGAPKVLHAIGKPGWGRYVTEALRAQGLSVDEVSGSALPATMHELTDYDLIILNNVSGFDISLTKMELLEDYVRDAGGGLISLGGDNSYGAGGYYGTPIERVLPVSVDVETEVRIPTLAVIIVIDRSGSMSSDGKLSIAKDAAASAIQVLNPLDRVGVLSFDEVPEWSVPPSEVGTRRGIEERLRSVASGGGTDLFVALEEAYRVMREQQARVKHLIVLSDGLTETERDFSAFTRQIAEDNITVSTVAFGRNANVDLMENIAAWGRGRFYHTDNPDNIPRIFTSDTLVVSRDLLIEESTTPSLVYHGEMIEGFGANSFPMLGGYQRIFAKPTAQVLLGAGEEDPLLVSWRYGLGKSVAFTSDLSGRWGREWVGWREFGRFVSQMARWTMRHSGTERLLPTFQWHDQRAEILVDVLDRNDRFINGLEMQASIVNPDRITSRFTLEQVAPGRYGGAFAVPRAGRYYINLSGRAGDLRVGPKSFGLAVPYSSEYLGLGVDREHLQDIAAATGGRLLPLSGSSISVVNSAHPSALGLQSRIWWPLFLAALIFLILEVAVRKIPLPESWRLPWQRQRQPVEVEPEYEELVENIARVREQHLAALRDGLRDDPDDPAGRARLYLTSSRRASPP